jgi:hypothetical protein
MKKFLTLLPMLLCLSFHNFAFSIPKQCDTDCSKECTFLAQKDYNGCVSGCNSGVEKCLRNACPELYKCQDECGSGRGSFKCKDQCNTQNPCN